MKSTNVLAVAVALALTGAGFASAQTVYHVSGSTAFRAAAVTAEVNYLNTNNGGTPYAVTYGASAPSSLTSASQSVIQSADGNVRFENNFSGSIAGVEAVNGLGTKVGFPTGTVASGSATFPSSTYLVTNIGSSTQVATGGAWAGIANPSSDSVFPEIIFSDIDAASAFTVINSIGSLASATNSASVVSTPLGIVPFEFVANTTTDVSDFSNVSVTPQNFADLFGSGHVAGSIFTGNSADTNITVYALGRDIDSGTRATALMETGYKLAGNGAKAINNTVAQYYPYDATTDTFTSTTGVVGVSATYSNPVIATLQPVPTETIDLKKLTTPDGGYASGGNLGVALTTQFSGSLMHTVLIGYIGLADLASSLSTDGGVNRQAPIQLGYNGSFITDSSTGVGSLSATDIAKIEYGSYTFWTYEREFFNNNNGIDPTTVASSLQTLLSGSGASSLDQISSGGVTYGAMKVSRSDDGLIVQ